MGIPKRPDAIKNTSLDDIIAAQSKIRDEATGIPPEEKKAVKSITRRPAAPKAAVVQTPVPSASSLVAQGEVLKQTIFNLPVSLNERIVKVAEVFHAGNKSHFVRAALEKAVAEYEERLKNQ